MRIVCPTCQAAYEVPAAALDAARAVRCVKCATDFEPQPEGGAAPSPIRVPPPQAPMVVADDGPGPVSFAPSPEPEERRGSALLAAAWAGSLALWAGGAWAFVAWRGPIAQAWPAARRIYAALGY